MIYILSTHTYPWICLEKLLHYIKPGDMILFKAKDNYNAIVTGYYTHVGIVVHRDDIPTAYQHPDPNIKLYLMEAKTVQNAPPLHHAEHNSQLMPKISKGIFIKPLINRIIRYKGEVYWRSPKQTPVFDDKARAFIKYAAENLYYEDRVIVNWAKKCLGEPLHHGTNCGELAYMLCVSIRTCNDTISQSHLTHIAYTPEYNDAVHIIMDEFLDCLSHGARNHPK